MNNSTILYILLASLLCFCFYGCNDSQEKIRPFIYFGGEIVNPNTNYIVFFKGNGENDTILLDKNNRFLRKFENLNEGLYFFRHNPENQLVLLEKGDSILIRLNTLEFDESLVFTGDGARKNNFLVDMYLQNEIERENLTNNELKLTPFDFKKKQDSLLQRKKLAYEKLNKKYSLSKKTKKIAQASFIFDYYVRHELYFRNRYGIAELNSTKDLPQSFFNYRTNIDYNDEDLKRLYSYNRYLNYYFANSSLTNYSSEFSEYNGKTGSTMYQLELVDSMIQNPYIQNNLLRRITANYLLESNSDQNSNTVLKRYLSVSSNKKSQKDLEKLYRDVSRLRPNNILPDQDLITTDDKIVQLTSLFEKPITALYFWSMDRKDHFVRAHKKASYLNDLYPNVDFIAINTDDNQTKNWLKTIKIHRYNLGKEYEFKYPKCSSQELVIYNRNKVILVNREGKIINAKASLFSSKLEKQLAEYSELGNSEKAKSYSSIVEK